jgi:signal transduction histidine kinase/ActR/RegA family two-component response regulator
MQPAPRRFLLRALFILSLTALIPLTIMAAVLSQLYERGEQQQMDDQLRRSAERAALSVSRTLHEQVSLLTILAESPRLDSPMDAEAFSEIADRMRMRLPDWLSVRVSDLTGNLLMVSPPLAPEFPTLVVDQPSHKRVVETASPVIGEMIVGPAGNPRFVVRVPVIRSGSVVRVLSATLSLDALVTAAENSALPAGWNVWIVDETGRTVATANMEASDAPAFGASRPGSIASNGDDLRLIATPIELTDWRMVLGMPLTEYMRPSNTAFWTLLLTGTLSLFLIGIAFTLIRKELRAANQREILMATWQRFDALSKMAGGLAHDFNNLLMGMLSGVEQLRRRRGDEEKFERVASLMLETIDRGRDTVQRLASFTKRSDTEARLVCLREQADQLSGVMRQAVSEDVRIRTEFAPDLWPVRIDLTDLQAALVNLASNSLDAMPDGGEITLQARNVEHAEQISLHVRGPCVVISVIDTGQGIEPEHISRIFDPFFTTKGPDAKGLGLSQVYGFARRSAGDVVASSIPRAGTVVHVLIPRSDIGPDEVIGADLSDGSVLQGRRALVVDDDSAVAHGVADMLDGMGMLTEVVYSAPEALKALTDSRFDLLVSDITMPQMSGLELAEAAHSAHEGLSILLMTGYSSQLESGSRVPYRILAKPFSRDQLLQASVAALTVNIARAEGNVIRLSEHR